MTVPMQTSKLSQTEKVHSSTYKAVLDYSNRTYATLMEHLMPNYSNRTITYTNIIQVPLYLYTLYIWLNSYVMLLNTI